MKIPQKSLCKAIEKYTFFPDRFSFLESINLCRRFGGKLVDVSTSAKRNALVTFLGKNIKEKNTIKILGYIINQKYDHEHSYLIL